MTDRLDRIEALLEATITHVATTDSRLVRVSVGLETMTERLDSITGIIQEAATQQRQNTIDIDNLLGAISTTDVEVRRLGQAVAANEERFNVLIAEMRSDRRASQQSFQALLLSLASVSGRVDDLEAG